MVIPLPSSFSVTQYSACNWTAWSTGRGHVILETGAQEHFLHRRSGHHWQDWNFDDRLVRSCHFPACPWFHGTSIAIRRIQLFVYISLMPFFTNKKLELATIAFCLRVQNCTTCWSERRPQRDSICLRRSFPWSRIRMVSLWSLETARRSGVTSLLERMVLIALFANTSTRRWRNKGFYPSQITRRWTGGTSPWLGQRTHWTLSSTLVSWRRIQRVSTSLATKTHPTP